MNVRFEFGPGENPHDTATKTPESECLITVIATDTIKAGAELLSTYGPDFWKLPKASV